MLKTTLNLLRKNNACDGGMKTLSKALGDWEGDKEIDLSFILNSNGLDHAIWAMRATTVECKPLIARLAIAFASESIVNYERAFPNDIRPRESIRAAGDFLDGKITLSHLEEKTSAAWSAEAAAWSAAWSAEAAARAAESAARAAWAAAWSAARAAAVERQHEIFIDIVSKG